MAGFGLSGHGSSFTPSPLAPPFTIGQIMPDVNLSSQVARPLGDFMHYSSSEVADNWPHTCPFTVSNDRLMPSSFPLDIPSSGRFPSLPSGHIFLNASDLMATASLPVDEAIPYTPFPLDTASDTRVPFYPSPYSTYRKQFEGNMPVSENGGSQGLNLIQENVGLLNGKLDSMTIKNKMELTPWDDGLLSSTRSDISRFDTPRAEIKADSDELDARLRSHLPYNSGLSSYKMPASRELHSRCLRTTTFSPLSFPPVSMEDWHYSLKPNTSSHGSYHQPGFHSVGPAVTKTNSFFYPTLASCKSDDNKTFQKQTTSFSWNVENCGAYPGLNLSSDDEQKSGVQNLNIENKDFEADNVGKNEMLFNFLNENSRNVKNVRLNQSNMPTYAYRSGLPVQSSFEVSDQLDHAVDSSCWKGASCPSTLLATVKTSNELSAVSLEATCSTPSRSLFPTCATSQLNHIDSKITHVDISKNVVDGFNSSICMESPVVLPCPVLPGVTNCDTKAACLPSISQTNTHTFRLSDYPEKSECLSSYGCSVPLPQFKADDIVHLIFNLSKLLSSQVSDMSALKDKDHESLQLTINNLTTCLSTRKMDKRCCHSDCSKTADYFEMVDEKNDPHLRPRNKQNPCTSQACKHSKFCSKDNFHELDALVCKGFETSSRTSSAPSSVYEKQFGENVFSIGENHRQTLVYKKLWIEAEAALSSLKYELMCVQMQLEVEKGSHDPIKDSKDDTVGNPVLQENKSTSVLQKVFEAELEKRWTAKQEISSCNDVLPNVSNSENTSQVNLSPMVPVIGHFKVSQNQIEQSSNKSSSSSDCMSHKSNTSGFDKAHTVEIEDRSKKMVGVNQIAPVIGGFRVSPNQIFGTSNRTLLRNSSSSDTIFNKSHVSVFDKAHNIEIEDNSEKMVEDDSPLIPERGRFSVRRNQMEGSSNKTFVETSCRSESSDNSSGFGVFENKTKCSSNQTSMPCSIISGRISQRSSDRSFGIAHNVELQDHSKKMVDGSPLVLTGRFRVDENQIDDSSYKTHVWNSNISDIVSQRSNNPGSDKAHDKIKDNSKKMPDLNQEDSVMARFRILQNLIEGSSNITPGKNGHVCQS